MSFLWNTRARPHWHRGADLHGQCTASRDILILLDKATVDVFSCKSRDRLFLPCGNKEEAKQDVCLKIRVASNLPDLVLLSFLRSVPTEPALSSDL